MKDKIMDPKGVRALIQRTYEYVTLLYSLNYLTWKRHLEAVILKWEDYPVGHNVISRVLLREKREAKRDRVQ